MSPRLLAAMTAPAVLLAACGGLSDGAVQAALEQAWAEQTPLMARAAGLGDIEPDGTAAGINRVARTSSMLARRFGGPVGGVVEQVVVTGAQAAEDFGGAKVKPYNQRLQLSLARGWSVTRLEVLDRRASDGEQVARVRYDVFADTGAGRGPVARAVVETVRLAKVRGRWAVIGVL